MYIQHKVTNNNNYIIIIIIIIIMIADSLFQSCVRWYNETGEVRLQYQETTDDQNHSNTEKSATVTH